MRSITRWILSDWVLAVMMVCLTFCFGCDKTCASSADCGANESCVQGQCRVIPGSWSDADVDSDTDTDSDTDSDTDTDTDADTDTDGDTDADTDADTDSDTDAVQEWVEITGGSFEMGDVIEPNSQPVHTVTVPTFSLQRREVTVAEYTACIDAGPCTLPDAKTTCLPDQLGNYDATGREDHPINCVTWNQASAYCGWIGGRLPTEAEWEYAARSGGQENIYPWGTGEPSCNRVVMNKSGDGCQTGHTFRVCSKPAGNTSQGLCDMAGNVVEWVKDWSHSYEETPTDGSAWVNELEPLAPRVVRGGAFNDGELLRFRNSHRESKDPGAKRYEIGLRCAK